VAKKPELIRGQIGQTRVEMGETLDALTYKANVPARTKAWLGKQADTVVGATGSVVSAVSGPTDSMVSRVSGAKPGAGRSQTESVGIKDIAERNPLGLAVAGAALGFVAGVIAPSTRIEDETFGELADEVKAAAVEAGHEALEHGKQVAQAASDRAIETAKEEGRSHADELASSVQEVAKRP
jgi:hypothetical protein